MKNNSVMLPWNVLLGISMASMVGILIYHLATPLPKFQMTGKAVAEQETRMRTQAQNLYQEVLESESYSDQRIWKIPSDQIGPITLESTTSAANKLGLTLTAFRPQKPVEEGALIHLPFLVSIEGTYTKVVEFVREMESPVHKIVVHIVQLAASDGSSSTVSAVVGLWAFQKAPPKVATQKGRTKK